MPDVAWFHVMGMTHHCCATVVAQYLSDAWASPVTQMIAAFPEVGAYPDEALVADEPQAAQSVRWIRKRPRPLFGGDMLPPWNGKRYHRVRWHITQALRAVKAIESILWTIEELQEHQFETGEEIVPDVRLLINRQHCENFFDFYIDERSKIRTKANECALALDRLYYHYNIPIVLCDHISTFL